MDQPNGNSELIELRLTDGLLQTHGLPDIAYPIRPADFEEAINNDRGLPLAAMLYGLQMTSGDGEADLAVLEPPMARLAELISEPQSQKASITAAGDDWWVEIGPISFDEPLVTIQRRDRVVAAIAKRDDGRLRISTYRPLDAKSADYLISLSQIPHPTAGVCMRENNWEYALDCSATMGNIYADTRGESYLSYWGHGLGVVSDGTDVLIWRSQIRLAPRPAPAVAAELGVHHVFQSDE